jgi:hypothetical protein
VQVLALNPAMCWKTGCKRHCFCQMPDDCPHSHLHALRFHEYGLPPWPAARRSGKTTKIIAIARELYQAGVHPITIVTRTLSMANHINSYLGGMKIETVAITYRGPYYGTVLTDELTPGEVAFNITGPANYGGGYFTIIS